MATRPPGATLPDFSRPAPASLGLSLGEAQLRFPFHLRTIDDPWALLLGCAVFPSGNLNSNRTDAPPQGTVFLDYLFDDERLSLSQRQDDDVDGPLRYVVKPGATRWRAEVVGGFECAVLKSQNGERFSSVNWKEVDGVVFCLEPRDLVRGLDEQLVLRIPGHLR